MEINFTGSTITADNERYLQQSENRITNIVSFTSKMLYTVPTIICLCVYNNYDLNLHFIYN